MENTPHHQEHRQSDESDTPLDDTQIFEHGGTDSPDASTSSESLFETYKPKPISAILAHRDAVNESHAAEAAAIILDGVVPLEFDPDKEQPAEQLIAADPLRPNHHIRVQKTGMLSRLFSPGAQFVYSFVLVTLLGGLIGLAATLQTPILVLLSGILSPIMLPLFLWKWLRWLDSAPYYYRLLSSLGEDAYNLLNYRLLWKRSKQRS